MQARIKITQIKTLPGDFWLVDFSLPHQAEALFLESNGLIQYQDALWPVAFFNTYTQTGQMLIYQLSLALMTGQIIEVELVKSSITRPDAHKKVLILASEMGLGYALFLAKKWKNLYPLVLLGAKKTFPFAITPSQFLVKALPAHVTAGIKVLEDLRIVSRLATEIEQPGCFHGEVLELADYFLKNTPYLTYRFLGKHLTCT